MFILGAGASKPYGYPTGKELRKFIYSVFKSQFSDYYSYDKRDYPSQDTFVKLHSHKIEHFAEVFYKSSTQSIDLFLSRNPQFAEFGKMGIIAGIVDAERKSKFREEMENEKQDWYTYLYTRMTSSLITKESYPEFAKNKVNFITFNYDRSLEYFIYESFTNSFRESQVDGRIRTSKEKGLEFNQLIPFSFLHVYGKIAPFFWESDIPLEYGFEDKILPDQLTENIKVIHERNDDAIKVEIKKLINWAHRIYFLGFAYADENMEILDIPQSILKRHHVFGTAMGSTERERKEIMKIFREKGRHDYIPGLLEIVDMDCVALLREYL